MDQIVDQDGYVRNKYTVFTPQGVDTVRATYWTIESGALVFTMSGPTVNSFTPKAFSQGRWFTVEQDFS